MRNLIILMHQCKSGGWLVHPDTYQLLLYYHSQYLYRPDSGDLVFK